MPNPEPQLNMRSNAKKIGKGLWGNLRFDFSANVTPSMFI